MRTGIPRTSGITNAGDRAGRGVFTGSCTTTGAVASFDRGSAEGGGESRPAPNASRPRSSADRRAASASWSISRVSGAATSPP